MEGLVRPVVIVSVVPDLSEVEALVDAAGHRVVERVVQHRRSADPNLFLGRGAVATLAQRLADPHPPVSDGDPEGDGWLVVANAELRPSQVFNLEEALDVEVWDRIRLILEIFQANASVKEARLQVELARMRYELPYVHEAVHRRRTGERPGFMSGGEYEVRTYETHLKRRVKRLVAELEGVRRERKARRAGRRRTGFRLAAIAGYTNAGKSRLLNTLCQDTAVVEDRFFSTLETRTRRVKADHEPDVGGPLLVTDTVGFIRGLPPWLIDAFAATLEEVVFADVVLLVVDASEEIHEIVAKLTTALQTLEELGATQRVMILLNKKDKLSLEQAVARTHRLQMEPALGRHPSTWISAQTGEGIGQALRIVWERLLPTHRLQVELDVTRSDHASFESWLRDHAHVEDAVEEGARRRLRVECSQEQYGNLLREAHRAAVEVVPESSTGNKGGWGASP